ncbi:addiction module toxin RelE [Candidatus Woesearchaeota archaeon]|jgi:mRNA-degrading endonuclease RelE of RelBE toxin-antitoxin system|nr:addiction module toxin RelE [Candidatus Woesearchaeota archaeon]MBT4151212.1 addiction module toxin RelE [Candidatus Woesearchaeota archaeon]MBT4247294.1 addiction module toxin RelE [Candidatus Woesearchaeota archaeon]MBT4434369.1 addiction module toxin RelE [Candidatus Woesearchaeota archaeon]MBT7331732.1 addiction module toxin RelE [Candidatus Woesearchaeota archaeon]
MRKFSIYPLLQKKLKKVFKKDKVMYEIIMKKIEEICYCENVNHYKNLRKPLQELKRVHIKSSFVLTFKHVGKKDLIEFTDFDHHDNIYN